MGALTARLAAAWTTFWFTRRPSSTLALFRVALGFTVLVWTLTLTPDLFNFYATDGLEPNVWYSTRFTIFRWWQTDTAIVVNYVVLLASSIAVMSGRFLRLAGPLMWVALASFQGHNRTIGNSGDGLLRLWSLFFGLFCLATPSREIRSFPGQTEWRPAPTWVLRLVQIQLPIIYLVSMSSKLGGSLWLDGTAVPYVFRLADFARFPLPPFLIDSLPVGAALTWGTLALELALVVILWIPKTRRLGIVLGLGLHIGFDYALRVGFFGWAMVIGYLAFLTPSEAAWWLNLPRRVLRKPKIMVADQAVTPASSDSGRSNGDGRAQSGELGDLVQGHGPAEEEALSESGTHRP